jgi:hexosaminidase
MNIFTAGSPAVNYRMVHFDLKGTPPTFERLLTWLKLSKLGGYNAVLVEWEDTFPWEYDERFRGKTCYTHEQIAEFLDCAKSLDIEIVPLVQCMGHMETVLSIPDYAGLREIPERIDCLNPLAEGAAELIEAMYDEMLKAFPDVKYFHIGGDEVWALGSNPATAEFIDTHSKAELYIKFVEPLLDKLAAQGIRPIVWHDMMSSWEVPAIRQFAEKADMMVWGYSDTPETTQHHFKLENIRKFHEAEACLWAAGQFKGRFEPSTFMDEAAALKSRQENTAGWIRAAEEFGMKGICLTAWSRNSTSCFQNVPIECNLDYLIYLGAMLWNGQLPEFTLEDAAGILDRAGELEAFKERLEAFRRFSDVCSHYWNRSRYLRYIIACNQEDHTRHAGSLPNEIFTQMNKAVEDIREAACDLSSKLYGLMDDYWADAFCKTRIAAVETDYRNISSELNKL